MRARNTLTLGRDRALYLGEIPATGWHQHAAPVLLLGLSGRFGLHLPGGQLASCRSALIDASVEHLFDPCGEHVALMYLEPDSPQALSLRGHFGQLGKVVLDPVSHSPCRSSMDRYLHNFDLPALLRWDMHTAGSIDARVLRSVQAMRAASLGAGMQRGMQRDSVAQIAQLSSSRFNHLFRQEMGVSYRSYRVWTQVRAAMLALSTQASLTDAALEAGFSDSSHFSNMFRTTFGMTPSSVVRPLRSVSLLG
jgi:AraC-like DNA-binding protein